MKIIFTRQVLLSLFCLSLSLNINGQIEYNDIFQELIEEGKNYFDRGYYQKADSVYRLAASIQEKYVGKENLDYAIALNGIGKANLEYQNDQEAEPFLEEALRIRTKLSGTSNLEYAETLSNIGFILYRKRNYNEVKNYFQKALEIVKKMKGKDSYEYAEPNIGFGLCYMVTGEIKEARKLFIESSEIYEKTIGKDSPLYSQSICYIGLSYFYEGNYSLAELYVQQSVELDKKAKEPHPYHIGHISMLTTIYGSQYKEQKTSELLLSKAINIYKEFFNTNQTDFYVTLSINYGNICSMLSEYEKAISSLEESIYLIPIVYKTKNHQSYANALNGLAAIYYTIGQLEKAEAFYLESLEVRKILFGENSPEVANLLVNLGSLYLEMKVLTKAMDYYNKVLKMLEKNKTERTSLILSRAMSGMASAYYQMGDYESDLSFSEKAAEIQKIFIGEDISYFVMMENIINLHSRMGYTYDYVETEYKELLSKKKSFLGENNASCLYTMHNLNVFYMDHDKYQQSLEMLLNALKIVNLNSMENAPIYKEILLDLGKTYMRLNNLPLAYSYFEKANKWITNNTKNNFIFLSSREKNEFWLSSMRLNLFYIQSFYIQNSENHSKYTTQMYDNELFAKSILLSSFRNLQQAIYNSENNELIESWEKYIALKEEMRKSELAEKQHFGSDLFNQIEDLEKKLTRESKEFNQWKTEGNINWKDIRKELGIQDAAIEFIQYNTLTKREDEKIETLYCALILRPDSEYPELVPLCSETELETAINDFNQLHEIVWKPIRAKLSGIRHVYIAPSGLLNTVSFSGISDGNKYVCDDFIIHNLFSTRDIIKLKNKEINSKEKRTAALFGGMDYGLPVSEKEAVRGQGFAYLSGSKTEVEEIERQLTALNWNVELYTGQRATKTQFRSLSADKDTQSPNIIHISTHGFYSQSPSVNSLTQTGLAFAGANQKDKKNITNMDDGILTAYEISNLNLDNTDLVALSACETGLGEIARGEGVYGLQRAFRLAGAHSLIVSLWSVPDKETMELMTEFYAQLANSMTFKEAFDKAQMKMRRTYPDQPEKWAGFVMIE